MTSNSDKVQDTTEKTLWYGCFRWARPFKEVKLLPEALKIPAWFTRVLGGAAVGGLLVGCFFAPFAGTPRVAFEIFYAALFIYLTVSALDLWEHFQLEKYVTGNYFGFVVVPIGESVVHGAIAVILTAFITLARPLELTFGPVDWFLVSAPILFLAFGWFDEVVFHRRRALHKEDILHTVSHLAAAAMLVSLAIAKMTRWG